MARYRTCGHAWVDLMRSCLRSGHAVDDDKGTILELPPQSFDIGLLEAGDPILRGHGDLGLLPSYREKYLGSAVLPMFGYSYGQRLFSGGPSPWDEVVARLRLQSWSKSAWLPVILPSDLSGKVPCLAALSLRVRDRRTSVTAIFRSQNLLRCYLNYLPLAELQRDLARCLDLRTGPLRVYVESPHLYERDVPQVRSILAGVGDPDPGAEPAADSGGDLGAGSRAGFGAGSGADLHDCAGGGHA